MHTIFCCIYVLYLPCPSVDGHLGCFCALAIVDSATVNTEMHTSFHMMIFSGYKPSSELLDYMTKEYIFKMKCRVPFDLFLESPSQSCHMLVFCTLFHPKVPMKQALPGKE